MWPCRKNIINTRFCWHRVSPVCATTPFDSSNFFRQQTLGEKSNLKLIYRAACRSCVSITLRIAQNLNIAIKNWKWKNLSNIATRFWRCQEVLFQMYWCRGAPQKCHENTLFTFTSPDVTYVLMYFVDILEIGPPLDFMDTTLNQLKPLLMVVLHLAEWRAAQSILSTDSRVHPV